ncbi:hypothetical protein B0H34DRAFT_311846 [Crassisporium funariophilum]|nr:hypothetical protein B0H34DRAFT_311846 [Crassisporium funariophilum]
MSALSGITVSSDLASKFAAAVEEKSTRFLIVSIQNELLVHDRSVPIMHSFEEDLGILQDESCLHNDSPAYILAKLDTPSSDWMTIFYVPDSAKVRDKMLYASTRLLLLKSLGSTLFSGSIFATTKDDFTAEAYASHLRHAAAPHPLSAREQETIDLRAAENETASYGGSSARISHIGTGVGLNWSPEVEDAVKKLGKGIDCSLVIITIDPNTETLSLHSASEVDLNSLGSSLPQIEPCYSLFAWPRSSSNNEDRKILFIYSCPTNSPTKYRMIYSSGATSTFQGAKNILNASSSSVSLLPRRFETSDPLELDEKFFNAEFDLENSVTNAVTPTVGPTKGFAKPKGPPRRR